MAKERLPDQLVYLSIVDVGVLSSHIIIVALCNEIVCNKVLSFE